jgi:hypothetical protein
MDDKALGECCAALGREPADVLALFDSAQLLPALLARQILQQQFLMQRQAPRDDPDVAFCRAVLHAWGKQPITASDLLDEATGLHRRTLREAICALCNTGDFLPSARQLGIALRRLSLMALPPFRVEGRAVRGTMEWTVRESLE